MKQHFASAVLLLIAAVLVYVAPNAVTPTVQANASATAAPVAPSAAPIRDPCGYLHGFHIWTGLLPPGCEFDCWQLVPTTCYVVEVWCPSDPECRTEYTWCGFGPGEIITMLQKQCLCCFESNIPCEQYTGSCP